MTMQDNKICSLTVNMTEETASRLTERALASDLTLNDFVVKLIEDGVGERLDDLEQSIRDLENLVWRSIYWSALPFIEGRNSA